MEVTKILDPQQTPDEVFDEQIDSVFDVENFLRVLAARFLLNDGDVLFVGNGHNGYMLRDPNDGLWTQLPFDHGFSGGAARTTLLGFRDRQVTRLLQRPQPLRLYYRILDELLAGYWNEEAAGPYFNALRPDAGVGSVEFVRGTEAFLSQSLEPFVAVPLRVVTTGGQNFESDGESVVLEGNAPVGIETLLWRRGETAFTELPAEWVSATRWRATFALTQDENHFEFLGVAGGETVATTAITVRHANAVTFVRGDVNNDTVINLLDSFATLAHLFGRELASCRDASDLNDDGAVDVTDAVIGLEFLFRGGAPPAAPFPGPGIDPTEDALDCGR